MARDADGSPPPTPTDAPARGQLSDLSMVWSRAAAYPGHIVVAALALLTTSAATIAIPYGFKRVVDRGFGGVASGAAGGNVSSSFHYLLMIVVVLAIGTAIRFYFVSWLGERVIADIRTAVHANLLRLAPRFYEVNRPSEIASRMTSDTTIIEFIVSSTVSIALRNMLTGIGGLIYLFVISPKLAGMLMIAIPLMIGPMVVLGRRLRTLSRTSQDRVAEVGAVVTETLGAMKVVQAFGQEAREHGRFGKAVSETFETARQRILLRAGMTAVLIALVFGSITLVLWEGAIDVAAGRLSGGSIAAFVLTGGIVAGAASALTEVYGDLLRGAGAASRLAQLLREPAEIAAPAQPVALPQPPRGALAFEHVAFRYPTRLEVAALDDFSLSIAPGETVAVVGPSGAGKSTLFQLAERFYDPQGGRITIDGVALPDADPAAVRARIAMVPQETVIFGASARDNLRYGHWEAGDEALWTAAEAANAADFLRRLPEGLDTFLGEGGARLSGGQRQRIAIARALLRDAPILLLDEATSALDAESERLVQEALERLMATRTTLVIAHRLATVRAADRIVVMDEGRIVEQGNHAALIGRGGLYARLASLQFNEAA